MTDTTARETRDANRAALIAARRHAYTVAVAALRTRDVITDAYGNPAVVVCTPGSQPCIIQLAGSDYGRVANLPALIQPVTGADAAHALARLDDMDDARRTRIRRALGITR